MNSFVSGILSFLSAIAAAVLKAFPGAAKAPAPVAAAKPAAPTAVSVTADGVNAIEKIFGPLVDIVRGKGTITDDEEAVNVVANIVATFNPELAPAIGMIEAAEPAALYVFNMIRANPAIFAPAPRGGPPITEADWSHGFPQAKPVDNPSGAIGGQ